MATILPEIVKPLDANVFLCKDESTVAVFVRYQGPGKETYRLEMSHDAAAALVLLLSHFLLDGKRLRFRELPRA